MTFRIHSSSNRNNWNEADRDLAVSTDLNESGWVSFQAQHLKSGLKDAATDRGQSLVQCTGKGTCTLNDCPKDIFAARQGMQLDRGSFAKVNQKKQWDVFISLFEKKECNSILSLKSNHKPETVSLESKSLWQVSRKLHSCTWIQLKIFLPKAYVVVTD